MPGRKLQHVIEEKRKKHALLFHLGDERGLKFFFNEFFPALVFFGQKFLKNHPLAEEVASDALVKTWKMHSKLDNFFKIRSYLYQVVKNDCLTIKRRTSPVKIASLDNNDPVYNPFDDLLRAELYRSLHLALKNISPSTNKVLTMHFMEGKKLNEIARELHVHPSTVKTQKKTGLISLRKKISMNSIPLLSFIYLFFLSRQ